MCGRTVYYVSSFSQVMLGNHGNHCKILAGGTGESIAARGEQGEQEGKLGVVIFCSRHCFTGYNSYRPFKYLL